MEILSVFKSHVKTKWSFLIIMVNLKIADYHDLVVASLYAKHIARFMTNLG